MVILFAFWRYKKIWLRALAFIEMNRTRSCLVDFLLRLAMLMPGFVVRACGSQCHSMPGKTLLWLYKGRFWVDCSKLWIYFVPWLWFRGITRQHYQIYFICGSGNCIASELEHSCLKFDISIRIVTIVLEWAYSRWVFWINKKSWSK